MQYSTFNLYSISNGYNKKNRQRVLDYYAHDSRRKTAGSSRTQSIGSKKSHQRKADYDTSAYFFGCDLRNTI